MSKLIVDFVVSEEARMETAPAAETNATPEAVVARPTAGLAHLSKCSCGSNDYVLASELEANIMTGIPASRMYECLNCGTYRLG